MAPSAQDLVGLEAVSRDGDRIGPVKDLIGDSGSASEYLVIKYGFFRDLVVPADMAERRGDEVALPFVRSFLDVAPRVSVKGPLAENDRRRLEEFYRPRAA